MSEYLTPREFDQFRIDDREWKLQMNDRMDVLLATLSSQDKRLLAIESSNGKTAAASNKMVIGISTIVTAIINGIIASFSMGGK